MSITTVELNPGTGGAKPAVDSLDTINSEAAPVGAVAEIIKPSFGRPGEATLVSAEDPMPVVDQDASALLLRLLTLVGMPPGFDPTLQRLRATVILESGTVTTVTTVTTVSTVSTVTTVGTVSNISQIDGMQARALPYSADLSSWNDCLRSRMG